MSPRARIPAGELSGIVFAALSNSPLGTVGRPMNDALGLDPLSAPVGDELPLTGARVAPDALVATGTRVAPDALVDIGSSGVAGPATMRDVLLPGNTRAAAFAGPVVAALLGGGTALLAAPELDEVDELVGIGAFAAALAAASNSGVDSDESTMTGGVRCSDVNVFDSV
jgi:hypothetical protein